MNEIAGYIECQVCKDTAVGFHCGAHVCEACKVTEITFIYIILLTLLLLVFLINFLIKIYDYHHQY